MNILKRIFASSDASILCLPSVHTHSLSQRSFFFVQHHLSGTICLVKLGNRHSHLSDHLWNFTSFSYPTVCMHLRNIIFCVCELVCVCVYACMCVCVMWCMHACVCVWACVPTSLCVSIFVRGREWVTVLVATFCTVKQFSHQSSVLQNGFMWICAGPARRSSNEIGAAFDEIQDMLNSIQERLWSWQWIVK